jgi:hypothetical protein
VIASTWIRDIRDHKWLAVRAVALGWAALIGLWLLTIRLVALDDWLLARGVADIRRYWPDPTRPLFHFIIGGCVNALAGWIVGTFHRKYRAAMVLVFFLSVLVIWDLPRFVPAAIASLRPGQGRFWAIVVADFVFMRLPIVAAGIWGVRDPRDAGLGTKR